MKAVCELLDSIRDNYTCGFPVRPRFTSIVGRHPAVSGHRIEWTVSTIQPSGQSRHRQTDRQTDDPYRRAVWPRYRAGRCSSLPSHVVNDRKRLLRLVTTDDLIQFSALEKCVAMSGV